MVQGATYTSDGSSDDTVHIVGMLPEPGQTPKTPVVFIHGLWLHASSWHQWVEYFADVGYDALAPGWPGFPDDIQEARQHPDFMAEQTISEVVEHYSDLVRVLPQKPVVIGHSFGGLVAQQLLDRDLVAAAVAIDPAPVKGVFVVPFTQIRAAFPVLRNPFSVYQVVGLKPREFRYSFANRLSELEAATLYYDWTIPAPGKPLWQTMFAGFNPHAQNRVDLCKDRAPLLLMSGMHDHAVSPETTRKVHRLYRRSPAVTDLKEWPGRGHSLVIDNGWHELADYTLEWLEDQGVVP